MDTREPADAPVVVQLPDELDLSNVMSVGTELLAAVSAGAAVVIADLSGTTFCDGTGVDGLLKAGELATANGVELRLVATSQRVLRVFELTGLDGLLPVYRSLGHAQAGDPDGLLYWF
jgi:anti-sigma B factor antagonist